MGMSNGVEWETRANQGFAARGVQVFPLPLCVKARLSYERTYAYVCVRTIVVMKGSACQTVSSRLLELPSFWVPICSTPVIKPNDQPCEFYFKYT